MILDQIEKLNKSFPKALFTKQQAVDISQQVINQFIVENELENVTIKLSLLDFDIPGDEILPLEVPYLTWSDIEAVLMSILSEKENN
ncbi:MAG: hypothetical protein Q8910_00195 [Bacteroidota bacterium]|nr:hypothetical protein [Bacteroidota bacterium]